MVLRLETLATILESSRTIGTLAPNTGNLNEFYRGIRDMTAEDLYKFAQAIDTLRIAANHLAVCEVEVGLARN